MYYKFILDEKSGPIFYWHTKEAPFYHKKIERILFLEGQPIVTKLGPISIFKKVDEMHNKDRSAEEDAIKGYNDTIKLAEEVCDNGT